MWSVVREKILRIPRAAGAEVMLAQDGKYIVHIVCVSVKKNKVLVEKQLSGDLNIFEQIPRHFPIYISFTGRGIFSKKIPTASAQTNIIEHFFPEANPNEFYYTTCDYNTFSAITVARKKVIDAIVTQLIEQSHNIINVSIGFQELPLILPHITTGSGEIRSGSYVFTTDGKTISGFETNFSPAEDCKEEFIFSAQYLPQSQIIALAGAVALLADDLHHMPVLAVENVAFKRKDFSYFLLFKFWGWVLMVCVLVILLINFLFFSHYSGKLTEQGANQTFNTGNTAGIEKLEHNVARKELFLQHAGWMNNSKTSYFADRIASLLPSDIVLTSMQFNPLQKSNGSFRQIAFKMNTLETSGECSNASYLNQFINNLKNIPGIINITVLNYQYNKEKNTGSFILEILVN
jgi:hypothetical protein